MENHLIIGLGGTGGKIIRSLRKTVFQEFSKNDPEKVNIKYLYVDSSPEMMKTDDPSWNVLGKSVQLDISSQVLIKGENLGQKLKQIDAFPGIAPWIGDRNQWSDVVNSLVGEAAGGQKRRLGRFLLACRVTDVINNLKTQVRNLQKKGSTDVTFHICAGLAGGTGSGSLIDIIAQIRACDFVPIDNNTKFRIYVYAYLPELTPKPGRNTGNYHANGFAALTELNALSVGAYLPYDIQGIKGRLNVVSPFEGCFIFTNQNEKGKVVDPDKDMPNIVSSFLFETIVGSEYVDFGSAGKRDFFENLSPSPEPNPTNPGIPERSLNFLTFGIKKLAIPEQEIKEYLVFNFAEQAARQLKYNNWSGITGFQDSPKNINFDVNVRDSKNLNNWKLTIEHLILSKPIIEDVNTARWKQIDDHWAFLKGEYAKLALQKDSKLRLAELESLFNRQYEEQYRQLGVKKFYQASLMSNNLKSIVSEVKQKIEAELFNNWINGDLALFDIAIYLGSIIKFNDERLNSIEDLIEKQKTIQMSKQSAIKENIASWSKMGLIGEWLKAQKLFVAQSDLLEELYKSKTKLEGFDFAKRLIKEINVELYDLKEETELANKTVSTAIDDFELNIKSRVTDTELDLNNLNNFQDQVIRFYDPKKVIQLNEKFVHDEDLQKQQTSNIRRHIVNSLLGNTPSFKLFNQRLDALAFFNELQLKCVENVETATANTSQNVFGVNIIDRLKKEYGGNISALKMLMQNLMDYASAFAPMNNNEVIKNQSGTSKNSNKTTRMNVILPKIDNADIFRKELEEIITHSKPAHIEQIELFYTDRNPYEITFISNTSMFPLRFVKQTEILKEKYDLLVSGNDALKTRMLLHSEGDGSNLPPLFVEDINVVTARIKENAILTLLIGKAIGAIKEKKDYNGFTKLAVIDESGIGEQTKLWLGKTFVESCKSLDVLEYNKLNIEEEINTKFEKEYKHLDKLVELKATLTKEVQQLEDVLGNSDPDYQKILGLANSFIKTKINSKIS